MKQVQVPFDQHFEVLAGNERGQLAVMVLQAGHKTGGPDNRHAESDQWLYVVAGSGRAEVDGQSVTLQKGDAILIEKGEAHEIWASADEALQTINVYIPPEY